MNEPLCYFSEADLQGLLYAQLLKEFPEKFDTSYSCGPDSKGTYRTSLVHREYGATGGRRTDISVFAREDVTAIGSPNLTVRRKYIVLRFAFELGTEKTKDTRTHLHKDLAKLERATERGYLIYFFRDMTRSGPGNTRRARKDENLLRNFKELVAQAVPPYHVSYLCFVIRIARVSKNIKGKCEMLVPRTRSWRKVNLNWVRDDVYELLLSQSAT